MNSLTPVRHLSPEGQKTHRTVPIQSSISIVGKGYPDKLVIFNLPASQFWWVRYYTAGRILKRSTKTQDKREAIEFAKRFYEDILLRERNLLPISASPTFERCARLLISEQEQLIVRGERNEKLNINDKQKLELDILPFFKGFNVKDVSYQHINAYLAKLSERNLKPATLKIHLNLLHKILILAQRENLVDRLPTMPKVKLQDSPRGWFSQDQYKQLRDKTAELIKKKTIVRSHPITDEMRFLITFTVNTFLRPSDIKLLRHRNVEVVESENTFLRIQTEQSKTVNRPVISMEAAVRIYKDLIAFQKKNDRAHSKDDFIFFPHLKNRAFALQTMRRQFDAILAEADLKHAPTGEARTLYSLRHTSIMFRLTLGENIDLLTLARNARTSVDMIERFYAKPLQAEMNVEMIQSMRKPRSRAQKAKKAVKRTSK